MAVFPVPFLLAPFPLVGALYYVFLVFNILQFPVTVLADLYFHSPRGSNNKLSETQNNAQNQNRLFDSQNNARGGYQIGDDCFSPERGPQPCDDNPDSNNANQYSADVAGAMEGQMQFYHGSELYCFFQHELVVHFRHCK